ncbi:PP2C family protein-serine/threonine phosphatase [Trujillonella endophytica]|uniref:GAF domain-containing protein n=1 Tax=Trujillonella endophytica TaxID=673521 RepID=A0A1H8W834_9ACTN|nr:PP2C family protein-serine/threonine phosphatase [Trujillella endophytica]SEP23298.1 GAF domain-containing protein [Trujillella endophytica]
MSASAADGSVPAWLAPVLSPLADALAVRGGPVTWHGRHPDTGEPLTITAENTPDGPALRLGGGVAADGEPPVPAGSLDALSGSLDVVEAAGQLAALVVPGLADWATVTVLGEDGSPDRSAVAHRDPGRLPDVRTYISRRVTAPRDQSSLTAALRSGEPVQLREIALDLGPDAQPDPEVRAAWRRLDPTSSLFVPLQARGTALGMLSLVNCGGREPHGAAEIAAAVAVARRAAPAVDNARLYERQLQVAETLQHSLLTPPVQPAGLAIAVRYRPASSHALVGGDWYDAFEQSDGATLLVIGDVVGHNVEAASAMAQLRSAVRTLAYDRPDSPARILDRVDRVLAGLHVGLLATALVARLEGPGPDGGRALRWSSAGHLPPLLLHPDGRTGLLETPAERMLGTEEPARRTDHRTVVHPGDTVLLCTDGLVEAGRVGIDEGLARVAATVADLAGVGPGALCDRLLSRLVPDRAEDDVAVLAVRVLPLDAPA